MADNNQMKEILAKLDEGVKSLFDSGKYAEYLSVMSRFHNYSTRNTLLIYAQNPTAHRVAGYQSWKNNFNRQVKKGEHSIKILAPISFKDVKETVKIDPVSKQPILDDDGNALTETRERVGARFKPVSVFDISQTDGDPLPELAETLTGSVERYELFIDALRAVSPLPIGFEEMSPDTDGICYMGDRIAIREGMSEIQTVAAVIHEMAHAKLHDGNSLDAEGKPKTRRVEEVEAESISYVVCQKFGIETGANAFGYVGSWSKNEETKELQASLDTIRKAAAALIDGIEEKYLQLAKERGIDLTADIPAKEQNIVMPEMSLEDVLNNREEMIRRIMGYIVKDDPEFPVRALEGMENDYRAASIEGLREAYLFYFPNDTFIIEQETAETSIEQNNSVTNNESAIGEEIPLNERALIANIQGYIQSYGRVTDITDDEIYQTVLRWREEEKSGNYRDVAEYMLNERTQLDIERKTAEAYETAPTHTADEQLARLAFNRLKSGDMVYLEQAIKPVQLISVRESEVLFVVPDLMVELTRTHEQVMQCLHDHPKNRHLLDAVEMENAATTETTQQARTSEQVEPQSDKQAERPLTALQQKAINYGKSHAHLSLQSRLDIIAKAFNCKTATIERRLCTGKWRGCTDVSIRFDNGAALYIGTKRTPETKKKSVIDEFVNDTLAYYNPDIIAESKALAAAALLKREAEDNATAAKLGLQPYKFLNVELNDGSVDATGGHIGWYSVTLAVNGKVVNHIETGLNYDITGGKVSEHSKDVKYFVAGALKETDVDFVFNGVGFSSTKDLYTLVLSEEVMKRALDTLEKRNGKEEIAETTHESNNPTPDDKEFWVGKVAEFLASNDGKMELADLDLPPIGNHGGLGKFFQVFGEYAYKREFAQLVAQENTRRTGEPWVALTYCEGGAYRPDFLRTPTAMLYAEADKFIKGYEPKVREILDGGYDKLDYTVYYKRGDGEVCSGGDRYDIGDSKKVSGLYNALLAETDYYYSHPDIYTSIKPNGDIEADKERDYADIAILKNAVTTEYPYVEIEKVIRYAEGDKLDQKVFNKGEILSFAEADSKIKSEEKAMRERYVKKYGRPGDGDEELGIAVHYKLPGESEPRVFRFSYLLGDYDEERSGLLKHFEMGTDYCNRCVRNGDYGNVNAMFDGKTAEDAARLASEYTTIYETLRDSMAEPKEKAVAEQTAVITAMLPDPAVSIADMNGYGYTADELLPLSQARALELFDADNAVYLLYPDNTEAMALDREEIEQFDGFFGIDKADWERVRTADERENENKLESDFLLTTHTNMFGIYQVRDDIENVRDIRYASLDEIGKRGIELDKSNYKLVYAAPFSDRIEFLTDRQPVLNRLFEQFNTDHPADYLGRSMSMSDVVVLRYNGDMSVHYVDSRGFAEIDKIDFFSESPDNSTKTLTDERNSSPGGQTFYQVEKRSDDTPTVAELKADVNAGKAISLLDLANAVNAEKKNPPKQKGKPDFLAKIEANKQRVSQASQPAQKINQREVEQ